MRYPEGGGLTLAIALVGALALGVPIGTLDLLLVVLACPLMMFFMMRGMHGGNEMHGHDDTAEKRDAHDHKPFR